MSPNNLRLPKLRKLPDPDVRLVIKLLGWQWEYGIGFNVFTEEANLSEEATLSLQGEVTTSSKAGTAGFPVSLNVYGLPRGKIGERDSFLMRGGVGKLQQERKYFSGGITMPHDVLPLIVSLLRTEQYPYLQLSLVKAGRMHFEIQSYRFRHAKPQPGDG